MIIYFVKVIRFHTFLKPYILRYYDAKTGLGI